MAARKREVGYTADQVKRTLARLRTEEYHKCCEDIEYFLTVWAYFEDREDPQLLVQFNPWPAQLDAIHEIERNKITMFLKARQIGITWLALMYAVHLMISKVGSTVVAISKTEEDAIELVRRVGVILSKMGAILKGGALRVEATVQTVRVIRPDGRTSRFKAFPASPNAGRSFTADLLIMDEWAFQQFAEQIWTAAFPTINRPTSGKVLGISTIKLGSLFETLWRQENGFGKVFIPWFADPRRDETWYEETKKSLGVLMTQEYPATEEEALSAIGGRYFSEFDVQKHVIDGFDINDGRTWKLYASMDYGLDMLAYYLYACDTFGNVYLIRGIEESGLLVADAAKKIIDLERGLPRLTARYAPPDLWAASAQTGKTIADGFAAEGVHLVKADNHREGGSLYVKELLRDRMTESGVYEPRLKIFRSAAPLLIRSMSTVLVDDKNPRVYATEPHELTHGPDSLRYFAVQWWLPAKEKKVKEAPKRKWTSDMREDYRKADAAGKRYLREKWGRPN